MTLAAATGRACVLCRIVAGRGPAHVVWEGDPRAAAGRLRAAIAAAAGAGR